MISKSVAKTNYKPISTALALVGMVAENTPSGYGICKGVSKMFKTCNQCCTVFYRKLGKHCPVCQENTIITEVEFAQPSTAELVLASIIRQGSKKNKSLLRYQLAPLLEILDKFEGVTREVIYRLDTGDREFTIAFNNADNGDLKKSFFETQQAMDRLRKSVTEIYTDKNGVDLSRANKNKFIDNDAPF